MITQQFLDRFEASLLKGYNRFLREGAAQPPAGTPEFMKTANSREDFLQRFMVTFTEQHAILIPEIERGGHRDAKKILDLIHLQVRNKMAAVDFGKPIPEQRAFKKAVLELKTEIRRAFY